MKEMTSVASTVMSEEDKAALERDIRNSNPQTPSPSPLDHKPASTQADEKPAAPETDKPQAQNPPHLPTEGVPQGLSASLPASAAPSPSTSPPPQDGSKPSASADDLRKKKGKQKLTPEQKQKLEELEVERRKAMEARVKKLAEKLIERIRPFVDAERPGDPNDAETIAFQQKMQREADDLKLESFGLEVRFYFASQAVLLTVYSSFCIRSAMCI